MDKELLTLSANNDLDRLRNIVQNKISKDEMVIMVEKSFSTKDHNFMKLLMALFKGLHSESSSSSLSQISQPQTSSSSATTKANHLFLFCVELLATKDMTTKLATDVVRLLIVEMDILNSPFLIKLSKEVIAYLRNPKIDSFRFLEILPKLLHQLRSKYSVATDTGDVKGAEFQNKIIDDICSIKWSNNSIVHLASIFKEVHLSPEELQPIMSKFFKVMTSMDIQEIPPLIYQLLILSSKGCKAIFLDGIINYFNREGQGDKNGRKDNGNVIDDIDTIEDPTMMMMMTQSSAGAMTSQLQQIEGTVIYHITSSIKQHQELGKEFVKYLKTNQHSGRREMLSSFVISLALSISKISAFESLVLELLKQIITYSYKDQRKKCESKWLRDNSAPFCDVTNLVMSSVKKMLVEWDVVMEGLVALGFSLMEVSVAKNSFGRPAPTQNTGVNILPSPVTSLNLLGSKMLVQCSKVHTNVAVEIVNQLINRIVTKGQEVPGHYKDLLVTLLKTSPHKYVENVSKFKDTFDYFSFLPLTTSHLLTTSLLPVVRICAPLKNGLVLFLRKSLFTRHLELRKIGVSGFLLLLKNFKVLTGLSSSQSEGSSSSQVAVDIHRDTSRLVTGDNKSLCLEIINSLRRCFGQQHDVRSLLYNGLCDVSEGNPALLGPIADLLLNQLKNYLDPNETNLPPLKVASCILMNSEVWQPAEPLADLVKNLLLSIDLLKRRSSGGADDDDNEEAFVVRVEGMIESVVNRLIKCDVDDFEVEKDLGFDASTPAGSRNISLAQLAVEVCEVFMQREVSRPSVDQEKIESMLKLFQVVGQVVDSTRETEGNKKNKTKKNNNNNKQTTEVQKPSPCVLGRHVTLEFIITITNLMFSQQDDNISNLLLSNNNFCNYFFNSTSTLLQHLSTSDDLEMKISGRAVNDPEQVTSDLCGLARILLKRYLKVVIKPNNNNDISIAPTATNNNNKNQPNSTKTLNSHCLKVFHQTLSLFSKKWIDKVPEFLVNLDILNKNSKRVAEKDPLEGIVFYIKSFQRVFITLLTTENESSSPKDRLVVMQCIVLMIGCCKKEAFLAECCDWFTRLFKEQVIGDSELLKLMLKELLTLLRRTDLTLNFVKDVCRDIHMCLGDVNQEVELDNSTSLPTVNHRSSVAIIQSILSHFESEIEDADWLIGQMRSQSANNSPPANEEDEFEEESPPKANGRGQKSLKNVCRNLIGRMSSMTDIFHELVQTNIPFGPSVELIFKVLNKFYGLLCSLAKLYIWNYGRKPKDDNIVIEGSFEKLIKHSALQLTRFIYPMINHIEKVESERLQAENEKHKNKKAKKNVGTAEKVKKMKETKLIPSLILSLEQYERLLIQLSKKSKVNLMVHFKISTSRDFRINNATLQGILEERGNGDDDDGDGGSDDDKRSNDVSVAMGNDDGDDNDDDVEEEIENMVRNDEEDDADDANQVDDDDDCGMSAPARKRIKLADKTPQTNKATEKKKLSRKSK